MANAILKITVFRRNIRMGKINRQDPILLKINNNYLIEKNLRIFYLISKIFPNEDLNYEISGLNISSNESFGFLKEDKEQYLNNDNNEELNIPLNDNNEISNISLNNNDENQDEDEDNTIDLISNILDNQLNISVSSDNQIESSINNSSVINKTYQTSSNFLQLRTNIYPTTKDFNNAEHNILKELYKKEFLGKITNINNAIDWNYVKSYWNSKVDKDAEPNSTNKIRPKSIENLKEHLLILENFYLRKQIEGNTLTGYYFLKL